MAFNKDHVTATGKRFDIIPVAEIVKTYLLEILKHKEVSTSERSVILNLLDTIG